MKKTKKVTKKDKPKSRHIMSPSKRTTKDKGATQNRILATHGDKAARPAHMKANQLLADLRHINFVKGKMQVGEDQIERKLINALLFAGDIWDIVQSEDGEILREMADLVEAPVARPALELAWSMRERWVTCIEAGGIHPRERKGEILRYIMQETGCSSRTAEKAATEAGLAEVFQWKAGRPRTQE